MASCLNVRYSLLNKPLNIRYSLLNEPLNVRYSLLNEPLNVKYSLICSVSSGKYLYVKPEHTMWIDVGLDVDYFVHSNTDWIIN